MTGARTPLAVQPPRFPVSSPPLTTSWGGAGTVRTTLVVCVAPVPVPVTVTVYVPGAVLVPTATVMVEEPPAATDVGLKLTVVPAGWPLALRLTVCAAPLVTAVEIVAPSVAPSPMLRLPGVAAIEKSAAVIVRPPGVVVAPTLTVMREEPLAVTYAGLKLTVVPAGRPLALRLTVCAEL